MDQKEIFSRQNQMFDSMTLLTRRIVILWCWFVWSNLAYNLMKTWFRNFLLVDFDTIEEWNLLNQMFTNKNIWMKKTDALRNKLMLESPFDLVIECKDRVEDVIKWDILLDWDLIFLSVDNPKARKITLEYFMKRHNEWNFNQSVICNIWTWTDTLWISMLRNNEEKLKFLIDIFSQSEDNYTQWICWNKSAYFIWSLISWLVIFELRNNYLKSFDSFENWFFIETNPLSIHDESYMFEE